MSLSHDQPRTLFQAVIEDSNRFFAACVQELSCQLFSRGMIFPLEELEPKFSLASEGN